MTESKSERLNLRISEASREILRQAADISQQDMTSFVLGSALEHARTVIIEDSLIRLSPAEIAQIESALDAPVEVPDGLSALVRRVRERQTAAVV